MSRLAAGLLASALIRRAEAEGGTGAVLAKGDAQAGGILLILAERGRIKRIIERGHELDGREVWRPAAIQVIENKLELSNYLEKRRRSDPDLWAIELDIADSERFAAEMTGAR